MALFEAKGLFYKAGEGSAGGVEIDDSSTALNKVWSASKLNTMIGNIETLLSQI